MEFRGVLFRSARSQKTPDLMRAVGRAVESLKGRYIIAEDVGTSVEDMAEIRKSTAHVVGLATEHGGGGDPSPLTAHGCFVGIRAAVDYVGRTEGLGGLRVAVDRQSVV